MTQAMAEEALTRAVSGHSVGNEVRVITAFRERGIPEAEIRPRENVLTFAAWIALGRVVRRGEHGVSVLTLMPMSRVNEDGSKKTWMAKRFATVFHVSQTMKRED